MDLIIKTLRSVSYAIVDPTLALVFTFIGLIFYIKNKKIALIQRLIMGETIESPLEMTLSQLVIGIFGGVLANIILNFFGVSFYKNSGIEFIFLISIFSIFFKSKYFKIPYSASILGLISIMVSFLGNNFLEFIQVNITYLVILVGIISFVQGILIILDGKRGGIPVFTNRDNKILGGFAFNRSWAFPIAISIIITTSGENISTPIWWYYLLPNNIFSLLVSSILTILPLYGLIEYDNVTFTRNKIEKTLLSGMIISGYGILLCLLAQLTYLGVYIEIIILIIMPVLFEGVKGLEKIIESNKEPLYISDYTGICILDVLPNSLALEQGIKSGYKIVEINGEKPKDENDIFKSLKNINITTNLKIKDLQGDIKDYIINFNDKSRRFGVILVPITSRDKKLVKNILVK